MKPLEPRETAEVSRSGSEGRSGRWPRGLAGRLLLVLALFTTLATAVVVATVYGRGSALLIADAEQRLDDDARGVVERVEHRIADRSSAVALLPVLDAAQDLAVDDIDKRLSAALAGVTTSLGGHDVALALDTLARVVAASDPTLIGRSATDLGWSGAEACASGGTAGRPIVVGDPEHLVVAAPVRGRDGARRLGCVLLATPWEALVRAAAAPVRWDALAVGDSAGRRWGGAPSTDPDDVLVGEATAADDAALDLTVAVSESRTSALAPVRTARRGALALALAILLVTLPAAAMVALGATGALRALARSALSVDGVSRPALPDPGPRAPLEVRVLHEALGTMLDRQEEARRALADREVLASLGTMAAGIAHEIRTPLAVMHGSAEMLARDPADPDRRRELIELITHETGRLDRLVATLLTFARPRPPHRQLTDLADVCRRAAPTLRGLAEQQGTDLDLDLEPAPARVDPEQMQQVVLNLVANAIQASPRHAPVRVTTRAEDGRATLEVTDVGAGIAPTDLARIWTPFFTTRPSGTGLGLAIVRRIVEAHAGRIDLRSTPGSGTTIRIILDAGEVETA